MEDLKRLKAQRGQIKAKFTRNETFVNNTVSLAEASYEMLEARLQQLVSDFKNYENINLDILCLDENDSEDISLLEEKYFHGTAKIKQAMAGRQTVEQSSSSSSNNNCSVKLPNIEISSYDGKDFTKYRPFMDLFMAVIDKNKSLSDIQKLFYLRKYLLGDALSVIINLPMVNESYPEALALLKKRFDNKSRVISNHINLILDLPQMQKGTASSIRAFISEVQQQIYALKNLEQPIEQWDMLLISVLSRKLDSYTCRAYHLDRENPENLPTIAEFISFLERRAIALEDSPAQKSTYYDSTRGKSIPCKVSNAYKKFINEYISLGHAKIVDIYDYDVYNDPVYFLAHHAVLNEDSKTTKLRVVFNGSMKTRNDVSLNDLMLNGPIVQSELFDVLTTFRTYRYTLMCDIEKMFRQVYINSHHTPLQNILWRDDPNKPIVCLQLQTVTYGLKASTYLSTRCLIELALLYKDKYPLAADAILKNTYVDDVICGSDSVDQLQDLKQQLINLLKLGSFTLHKWCSNNTEILKNIEEKQRYFEEIDLNKDNIIKTLGLKYNILTDTLMFTSPNADFKGLRTKREILSFIGKMFDPLGLIGPIIVTAKLFMQNLWNLKIGWDTVLPPKELDCWKKFVESLGKMQQINIPRGIVDSSAQKIELLGFCDASFKAIACCLYLRVLHSNGKITVELLCSKSRVAPLNKTLTIPNLELNSAVLLSQLAHRVYNTLKTRFPLDMTLHSDSQIVLAWLSTKNIKKGAYVSNRVKQIIELTKDFSWTYVKSADNPADILSRGTVPHQLQEQKLWWHGPEYLHMQDSKSRYTTIQIDSKVVEEPIDEICNTGLLHTDNDIFQRYSNFYKLKRIIALILRFKNNCLNADNKLQGSITPKELHKSQTLIMRHIQNIHFKKEIESLTLNKPIKSNLTGLHIFLDHNGILRVGGRLHNATNISYAKKHPIILPKSNNLTQLLIKTEHLRLLHAGPKLVLSSLSQRFWLVGGIREVKKVVNKCIRCFQTKAEAATQLMGSLPSDRITPSRPFEVTGIDFCGPFEMKIARIQFGGLWEAGVKSVKYHLKRVVGKTCLTFEELYTVITQIEAILNSRPLLPMSTDVSDLSYLTPGHFLVGAPLTSIPEPDLADTNINRLKFWQICIKLKQQFWKVWSSDYLTQLQNRPKWKVASTNLKEGDLVIVKQPNVPSLSWPMGRIVKTFPGSDNSTTLRLAVSLRLGFPICAPHKCPCGSVVDRLGHHGLSCAKSARSLASANVPAVLEPVGIARDDGKRSDGMSLIPWKMGRVLDTLGHFSPVSSPRPAHTGPAQRPRRPKLSRSANIVVLTLDTTSLPSASRRSVRGALAQGNSSANWQRDWSTPLETRGLASPSLSVLASSYSEKMLPEFLEPCHRGLF
ncbi:uncharacterized protein [Choristoneura fumiferana]|uniref:uncharacterized protein n=1 Tax=Choristoneura fumiferana TaxID=7141 RepID=UPI003D1560E6